jgi:hypothetical protein
MKQKTQYLTQEQQSRSLISWLLRRGPELAQRQFGHSESLPQAQPLKNRKKQESLLEQVALTALVLLALVGPYLV